MFGKTDFGSSSPATGHGKPSHTADMGGFNAAALRSGGLQSKKSIENQSMNSGVNGGKQSTVGFTLGRGKTPDTAVAGEKSKSYGAPTLKMLNPELFKEIEK